ncbi:helix-turn-helix transcriptional regulator [Glycomyces paridis]|uniref:Helix-turn-helix transcriptional regulator n=1 Tax=Glycomyces paridis TaxID=2126555 RepID=A0A4V4HNV6_9ACTN|nr:helix-turn-helix transcriptional regulator [Glycomyces paridis]THV27536.1 helix-turn-helix transcriptional regulator [Glycomyces paridis]
MTDDLIRKARDAAGLSQAELAQLAKTSRPALSAYEHGQKSPTMTTAQRILEAAGFELAIEPRIRFSVHSTARGRPFHVPDHLPRLPAAAALAQVRLPLHLNWSDRGRVFDLAERRQRARVYAIVLREGLPADLLEYVDGLLLADLWDELVLPREIREAWTPLIRGGDR